MNLPALTLKRSLLFLNSLILLHLWLGCTRQSQTKNQISKIELATGDCFGECAHSVVYIDSSLTYKFYGGEYADKKGYYDGKISQAMWDTLNNKLERIRLRQLDTSYAHTVDDQSIELFVNSNGKVKHIVAQDGSLPDSVAKVIYWLANSHKLVKLKKSNSKFKFRTRV